MSRQEGAMQIRFGAILIGTLLTLPLAAQAQTFPGADWQRKTPAEAGINPQLLKDAIDFSIASEIKNPRDLKLNRPQALAERASERVHAQRQRPQYGLRRSRERPRRGRTMDRQQRCRWLSQAADRGGRGEELGVYRIPPRAP